MLLVLDIGNTNIKTGLFVDGRLLNSWRFTTSLHKTSDEYGVQMESFFSHLGLNTRDVDGIIMSSVIPSINYTIEHMCSLYFFGQQPMIVSSDLKLGINIKYDYPQALGSDRICNAVASYNTYGGPCIVIDFGTATNFSVISAEGDFCGGLICPGIIVSADALVDRAAMLQKVEFVKPPQIISTNTQDAVRGGLIHGFVGQVDHIIAKIEEEYGKEMTVIATGGMSSMIAEETSSIDILNRTLTLEGLQMIYEMNR